MQADIPTLIGVIRDMDVDMDMDSSEFLQRPLSDKKLFIDTVNIRVPRKNMELVSFLKDGMSEWRRVVVVVGRVPLEMHSNQEMQMNFGKLEETVF